MSDLEQPTPSRPDSAGSREQGRTGLRVRRGAPAWAAIALVALLAFGLISVVALDTGWGLWVVLGGIVAVVAGLVVALNPRRTSPEGGTDRG